MARLLPILLRRPRPTVRARLAALYGGLFLATGTTLVAIVYLLLRKLVYAKHHRMMLSEEAKRSLAAEKTPGKTPSTSGAEAQLNDLAQATADVRDEMLRNLLIVSVVSLAVLALLTVLLSWWLVGRALRPLRRIVATARRLSVENLDERIALSGPDDELKELADTFDDMLARLEDAYAGQRRFVANASHELRTPLAIQRAAIQIGLADPAPEPIAKVREELLVANRRTERLIEGLLLLAQSEPELTHREPVALDRLASEVAERQAEYARAAGVRIDVDVQPTEVAGDPVLLAPLIENLVQNAVRYNRSGGSVRISVSPYDGVRVRNTGPAVPEDEIPELFEPFRRGGLRRTRSGDGAGLGLSIVRAIARAHHGTVSARPNPGGGLEVEVRLPVSTPAAVESKGVLLR
ncbi:sensor histidine kinase [Plantactinospora soyae]|uniref:histidine kinase n=1 Tax=Plantactinospora soyae TaxID=1544732 RepID=A0A927MAM2_9ACTN|nr:HAMP domain-containing sensor histidine kinase [Plantactinospora soyae]MBE1491062.1 signal transduction histidine kinase [Plantactinospora soyae]